VGGASRARWSTRDVSGNARASSNPGSLSAPLVRHPPDGLEDTSEEQGQDVRVQPRYIGQKRDTVGYGAAPRPPTPPAKRGSLSDARSGCVIATGGAINPLSFLSNLHPYAAPLTLSDRVSGAPPGKRLPKGDRAGSRRPAC